MDSKSIAIIIRTGAIISTTLASLAVTPPIIDANENSGINWKNIFTFMAGILSILLYDKLNKKASKRPRSFGFIGLLIICFVCYEILYFNYSTSCQQIEQGGIISHQCVTTTSNVKKEVRENLDFWINKKVQYPIQSLLNSYNCSSKEVWEFKDLMIPYYGFIGLYFIIILLFILTVISITDLMIIHET